MSESFASDSLEEKPKRREFDAAAFLPTATAPRGPWNYEESAKRFKMPADLRPGEENYVSFFMERVMPRLAALRASYKITDDLVGSVIRATSMGLIGLTEGHIYLEVFENKLQEILEAAGGDGKLVDPMQIFKTIVITLDAVSPLIQGKRRFPLVNDEACFFRDLGPNPITTFCILHVEEEIGAFVRAYNALPAHERAGKVDGLKEKAKETVESKVLGLPAFIHDTFQFMLEKNCPDEIWIRFIRAFDANACYEVVYNSIAPIGVEIFASGDGSDKRPANKIFAKMLGNVPQNLEAALKDEYMEAFVAAVKAASGGIAENPSAAFFANATALKDYFGGERNATLIRDFIGNGPDGRCKLTDAQMLELIYWSYIMSNEYIMPPGGVESPIAKLLMED